MKNHFLYFLLFTLISTSCHKVSVDFSYAPATPKTGENVTFTNISQNGEDYTWQFGDNQTANTKSTSHTYRKAGTYIVTLSEKRSKKTCTHAVTVTDSIATIGIDSVTIYRFDSVTLKAQVWNPFSHEVSYEWQLDKNTELISGNLDEDSIVVLFKHFRDISYDCPTTVYVGLDITLDGQLNHVERSITILDRPTWSLLYRTSDEYYYQLVYLPYYDAVYSLNKEEGSRRYTEEEGRAALDGLTLVKQATDPMEHKRYTATDNGLYVSHLNGDNEVQLCADSVGTILLDATHQRLFYTTAEGVFAMPLIYSSNNQSKDTPVKINHLTDVTALTIKE
ncbi:MAG: PKD domain-containing protein [Paludibacteraceae bacterium]|nr:PKD domain-containing protein [Paludibacteraceae bacterium]